MMLWNLIFHIAEHFLQAPLFFLQTDSLVRLPQLKAGKGEVFLSRSPLDLVLKETWPCSHPLPLYWLQLYEEKEQ